MFAPFLTLYPTVNNLAAPIFMNVEEVKSFAYGVDFSPPLQQMADLNKIIEDDDDALADRLFIIDKMFTYHSGTKCEILFGQQYLYVVYSTRGYTRLVCFISLTGEMKQTARK